MRFPPPPRLPPAKTLERQTMSLIQDSTTLDQLLQIHALLLKTSLDHNNFILAKFLRRCFAHPSPRALPYGRSLFDRILYPDAFIWNTMIRASSHSQDWNESLCLFQRMQLQEGIKVLLDSFSLSLAVQACGRLQDSNLGRRSHTQVLKFGFGADLFVQTALVEMYSKLGDLTIARKVFEEMPEKDLVSYNVMLAAHVGSGDITIARRVFEEMPERDLVSWNTMIYGYATVGDLSEARGMFDRSHERDLVSWSSMISAYAQSRQSNEALMLFREMQMANVMPDGISMVSVLSACGDLGALGMGKTIHEYIERNGIEVDLKLGTSLVDMYAKCGDIENSLGVFDKMVVRDVLSWSAMISGLANHCCGEVALNLFSEMILKGFKPNDITFLGVLSACSHIGLVSEGWVHFNSMTDVYGVSPKIEHYGCMVGLLGRAGHLEEARQLIRTMPLKPDAVVWRSLLNACRIHRKSNLAEEAITNLIELEPQVDGHYVLLSNVYAQASRWDGVAKIRKMMRSRSIKKVPGSSSIEVDSAVHEFVAGDKSHPKNSEIYQMLVEMNDRLIQAGYKPMVGSVLQDVDDQVKEISLAQHSEKLALAFGLLSTPPKSLIRIVKNLRVCEDCHEAFKLVSLIYDRQLIVRDRNLFHHFAKGVCSCRDYW